MGAIGGRIEGMGRSAVLQRPDQANLGRRPAFSAFRRHLPRFDPLSLANKASTCPGPILGIHTGIATTTSTRIDSHEKNGRGLEIAGTDAAACCA